MTRPFALAAVCAFVAMPIPANAWWGDFNYPIKLTSDTGGLNVDIQTYSGPAVLVSLHNRADRAAMCAAAFQYYRHPPTVDEVRSTTIEPGKRRALVYPVRGFGAFSTAFVDVRCVEAGKGVSARDLLLDTTGRAP